MGNVLGNEDGNLWFDTVSCKLYMRWNDQWIALSTNDYVSPDGTSELTGYAYKVDSEVQELKNDNTSLRPDANLKLQSLVDLVMYLRKKLKKRKKKYSLTQKKP